MRMLFASTRILLPALIQESYSSNRVEAFLGTIDHVQTLQQSPNYEAAGIVHERMSIIIRSVCKKGMLFYCDGDCQSPLIYADSSQSRLYSSNCQLTSLRPTTIYAAKDDYCLSVDASVLTDTATTVHPIFQVPVQLCLSDKHSVSGRCSFHYTPQSRQMTTSHLYANDTQGYIRRTGQSTLPTISPNGR